jgi:hypothetical protein
MMFSLKQIKLETFVGNQHESDTLTILICVKRNFMWNNLMNICIYVPKNPQTQDPIYLFFLAYTYLFPRPQGSISNSQVT